jgi:hypothetical protein
MPTLSPQQLPQPARALDNSRSDSAPVTKVIRIIKQESTEIPEQLF